METLVPTRPSLRQNPYVGPRTFRTEEAQLFFGRDREARELTALIVSQRLVLFYAPSGAGKSSLLNTKVIPNLNDQEGFEVLPVVRVGGPYAQDAANPYVNSLLNSLHQRDKTRPEFLQMTLSHFLDNLILDDGTYVYNDQYVYPPDVEFKPRVLLIDQFEEILTITTGDPTQRDDFFQQLAAALQQDDYLWVVLTMREDFIAGLDPFLPYLPNRLAYRYHMQRLRREAALEAIKLPAEKAGRPFAEGAAEILVDNLRRLDRKEDEEAGAGQNKVLYSQFVEPVQLQAVCFQMWEKSPDSTGAEISQEDVQKYADIDTALVNFYEDTIDSVVQETGIGEPELRNWFENELITEAGTRSLVFRGEETTGGLPTPVADAVRSHFIMRQVVRLGSIWFELIHDSLVQPILDSNQNWRLDQPLVRLAEKWVGAGRPESRLLEERALDNFLETNWQVLGPAVAEFIAASTAAVEETKAAEAAEEEAARQRELQQQTALAEVERRRAEEERHRAAEAIDASRRLRRLTILAFSFLGITILAVIIATAFAINSRLTADSLSLQLTRTDTEIDKAIWQKQTAEAAQALYADSLETQVAIYDQLDPTIYIVKTGDSLLSISERYSTTVEILLSLNPQIVNPNLLYPGQALALPPVSTPTPTVTPTPDRVHIVQPGETLFSISQLYGTTAAAIQAANPEITGPGLIAVGVRLVIPPAENGNVTPTATPTETPNQTATANAILVQEQIEGIRATQTAVASNPTGNIQTGMNVNPDAPSSNPYQDNTLLGLDWVRFEFKVDGRPNAEERGDLQAAFAQYDPIVEAYSRLGISIIFILDQVTVWGSAPWSDRGDWNNYIDEFQETAVEIAEHYAPYGGQIAYEIWNEPDLQTNVASIYVEPENYAALLDSAVAGIREVSPDSKILFGSIGGRAADGVRYIASVNSSLSRSFPADAIGIHPFGSWGTFDPFYNQEYSNLSSVFNTYNNAFPNIPLWITEIGVPDNNFTGSEYYPEIAAYMRDIFWYTNDRFPNRVPVVIWFAWSDLMRNAGVVDLNGSPKGDIYDAFQDVRSGVVFESAAAAE